MIRTINLTPEDRCITIIPSNEDSYFKVDTVKAYCDRDGILFDVNIHEVGGVWNKVFADPNLNEPHLAFGLTGTGIMEVHLQLGISDNLTVTIEEV